MNEIKISKLLAIIAVVFVSAALVTLPYQSQVANAAPMKRYQVYVTLTGVPANADNLVMNATLNRAFTFNQETTVSSPSEGDVVKFVFRVPSETNIVDLVVCGAQQGNPELVDCNLYSLPSKGGGPIRVNFAYPTS
ncbi:MAG: hypothetical protein ICV56_09045 [Nitrososphaeraceae archaeon]|nr:hypothetical protein [Nitrososphaeraceae archaeon]